MEEASNAASVGPPFGCTAAANDGHVQYGHHANSQVGQSTVPSLFVGAERAISRAVV